jgi:hypothetical protein
MSLLSSGFSIFSGLKVTSYLETVRKAKGQGVIAGAHSSFLNSCHLPDLMLSIAGVAQELETKLCKLRRWQLDLLRIARIARVALRESVN